MPYTDQSADGSLKCEGSWLCPFPRERKWFTKSEKSASVDLLNVVSTGVVMFPLSAGNIEPNRVRRENDKN